jgi:hypothetical protein
VSHSIDPAHPRGQRTAFVDDGERVGSWAYGTTGPARLVMLATRFGGVWELAFGDGEICRVSADRLPSLSEAIRAH